MHNWIKLTLAIVLATVIAVHVHIKHLTFVMPHVVGMSADGAGEVEALIDSAAGGRANIDYLSSCRAGTPYTVVNQHPMAGQRIRITQQVVLTVITETICM